MTTTSTNTGAPHGAPLVLPADIAADVFFQSAEERFALDGEYRARVQREAMNTDSALAERKRRWEERLWAEARHHAA